MVVFSLFSLDSDKYILPWSQFPMTKTLKNYSWKQMACKKCKTHIYTTNDTVKKHKLPYFSYSCTLASSQVFTVHLKTSLWIIKWLKDLLGKQFKYFPLLSEGIWKSLCCGYAKITKPYYISGFREQDYLSSLWIDSSM